jgi:hypothetical protein
MKLLLGFKVFMACLYIILGIYLITVKMDGVLANDNLRLTLSVLLIVYGSFRAYNLRKQHQNDPKN